jgi:DNA-binding HxlR family transcriptional regulator
MTNPITITSTEVQRLVECRIQSTIDGINTTLSQILENQHVTVKSLKEAVCDLEESFDLLAQKWVLQILYTLYLKTTLRFNELRAILGINSRTLSDKLKRLSQTQYIERIVEMGPPLEVHYTLNARGRNAILLALPLLYYTRTS